MRRTLVVAFALVVAACGGADEPVAEGVVIDVVSGLTSIDHFTIRTPDGEDLTFTAVEGVKFHGLGSLGHLRSHLATGGPIIVVYETADNGDLRALEVDDG